MTEHLELRALTVDDAVAMATVLASPLLYQYTGGEPPTVDELTRRYSIQTRGSSADGRERWINSVITLGEEHQPIGYVQATIPVDGSPTEIARVVGEPWQRQGHATRAARLLLQHLANQGVRFRDRPHPPRPHRVPTHRGTPRPGSDTQMVDGEIRWSGTITTR